MSRATQGWFRGAFEGPTAVQRGAWPVLAGGGHALLVAPTGSGKTLAAFLSGLDAVLRRDDDTPGVRVVYVSPLKALAVDVERNLRAPLVGIGRTAARLGEPVAPARVHVRTGDTPQRDRQAQQREPAEILVTTPESLFLLLTSQARETLRTVHTVIIDEIHTMVGTKRGVHLSLSLERLSALCAREPQRIGLSATVEPVAVAARFLSGDRAVHLVDTREPPHLDLRVVVPVDDMDAPPPALMPEDEEDAFDLDDESPLDGPAGPSRRTAEVGPSGTLSSGLWPSILPVLLEAIRSHRSTILFVNSRVLCERLAAALNELAGETLVRTHHGSLSHAQRAEVEEALKQGVLRAIVATSSLELGIDMGAVDLVICVESPATVASGLQRIGRAGHQVGAASEGLIVPKYRGDLLEAAVVGERMLAGAIEPVAMPQRCLDVLAQQIVAMVCDEDRTVDDLHALIRRAAPYAKLSRDLLVATLDMLTGRYPSDAFADLTPRLSWDRATDVLSARRGAQRVVVLNGGTIPDRGLYRVHLAGDGARLGELDEEMVYESREGDVIVLGASSWRIEEITTDSVLVSPAPGQPGRMPFWRGERPGRPLALGRALGAFLCEVDEAADGGDRLAGLTPHLDARAHRNLLAYIREQREATGTLPTDRAITVERFPDELGDWRICLLTPFGARVHGPWALAIEAALGEVAGFDVQVFSSDDGVSLRLVDCDELPPLDVLFPDPEGVEDAIVARLRDSALFAARFRENAARALLLPRRSAKGRTPLWLQRRKASELLAVASRHPSFPIVLETYRECLQDVFDVPALREVLTGVRDRSIRVDEVQTRRASPFARGLVFQYVAEYLYDGDAPIAERRAQALSLDRDLLRDLLGQEGLRDLLDARAIDEVEASLQHLDPDRHARHADALHDLLRRLGDLADDEIRARCDGPVDTWLADLEAARRVVAVRIAGQERWIAVEDAARYRDALGIVLAHGLPSAFLEPAEGALRGLIRRHARTHGPFHATPLAARWGLDTALVRDVLRALEADGLVVHAALRPDGHGPEWCDDEVLKRLRRASLAALRREVEPVEAAAFARFLPVWHGIDDDRRRGLSGLRDALGHLEDLPLPFSALEREILPARVRGYDPMMLDQLGAMGEIVWVGRGALGPKDGRIALVRREAADLFIEPSEPDPEDEVLRAILELLDRRGACFVAELQRAVPDARTDTLMASLWDGVWAGWITNDTFGPLRALSTPKRRGRGVPAVGGRWSLVRDLVSRPASPTERQLARARLLLERHGVVTRDAVAHEGVPGGFSALYPVLRELETRGSVRRGRFVYGVGGAQFALPGAVDRLRALRDDEAGSRILPATDPAQPWGATLPWPAPVGPGGRPQRVPGARVVLVAGLPVLWLSRTGRSGVLFEPAQDDDSRLQAAVDALRATLDIRTMHLDTLDGVSAAAHPAVDALRRAGFARDPKGLVLTSPRAR